MPVCSGFSGRMMLSGRSVVAKGAVLAAIGKFRGSTLSADRTEAAAPLVAPAPVGADDARTASFATIASPKFVDGNVAESDAAAAHTARNHAPTSDGHVHALMPAPRARMDSVSHPSMRSASLLRRGRRRHGPTVNDWGYPVARIRLVFFALNAKSLACARPTEIRLILALRRASVLLPRLTISDATDYTRTSARSFTGLSLACAARRTIVAAARSQ
jgi:hypothetical protein